MTLSPIQAGHPYVTTIKSWYETSFPADERRSFEALCQLLPCADMHLCGLVDQGQLVGFILYWHWPELLFVEHFAIDPTQRRKQYGQQAISQLLLLESPCVLLEVELPQDEISRRRIQFYERQGFSLNPFVYAQPPYQAGTPPIPMHLMSIPTITDQDTFDSRSKLIKERVYERFY